LALVYPREKIRRSLARFGLPVVTVVASIAIVLIGFEIALHLKYRNIQIGGIDSPSGVTFYRKYYTLNSWGFRDVERQQSKPAGTFRVLVLGDSFTFGAGIKFKEDLYPALLEAKLNSAGEGSIHFEVINTGIKGLNTSQQHEYLREKGLALDPDIVVIGHVLNDAETPELKSELVRSLRTGTLLPSRFHRILNRYSFTYYIARRNLIGLLRDSADSGTDMSGYDAYLDSLYRGQNLEVYTAVVAALAETCKENGLPMLLVSFPRISRARESPYPFPHITRILQEFATEEDIYFVDLLPAVLRSEANTLTVSAWDGHPNEGVHSIAAEEIYRRLAAEHLIPNFKPEGS